MTRFSREDDVYDVQIAGSNVKRANFKIDPLVFDEAWIYPSKYGRGRTIFGPNEFAENLEGFILFLSLATDPII